MLFNLYFSKKQKTKKPHDANYGCMFIVNVIVYVTTIQSN